MPDQTSCDRCGAELREGAAYCDKCGHRTRRARRNVRLAIRLELLFVVMTVALVFGFSLIYYNQH